MSYQSSSSSTESLLGYSTVAPTATVPADPNDNDTHIVTSDGTENWDVLEMWKYDAETDTWTLIPLGSECPWPMTRAALRALRTAWGLSKDCHYIITNPSADWNLDVESIILHAVDESTLSMQAGIKTSHDTLAWHWTYDIDADNVLEVTDNLENHVSGNEAILNFPFGVTSVYDNIVKNATLNYTWGTVIWNELSSDSNVTVSAWSFTNNIVESDANVVSAWNTARNHFEAQSSTTVNSWDFRENRVEWDATVTSSTTLDVDNNVFKTSSTTTITWDTNVDNNELWQASNTTISWGSFYENTIQEDATVTIISWSNYENVFGKSTTYRQVWTWYIRTSNIEWTTAFTNGNTNVSNINANTATINTTGSTWTLNNSFFQRAYMLNLQNIPSLTITDSTVSDYSTVQTNWAARIYIYRSTVASWSRVLCSAGSRIDMSYTNIDSYGYIQSTQNGWFLTANYCNISSLWYIRNTTPNTHRAERCDVNSSSRIWFEWTADNCRVYYSRASGWSSIYHANGSVGCYIYYNTADALSQIYTQGSTNARMYYNSADWYSYIRTLNSPWTSYIYYCSANGRGYIQISASQGRIYSCTVGSQSILEKRWWGTGNIYYSDFSAYYYAYITRATGTSSGLFGRGRRTNTITSPIWIAPYAVGSSRQNF